MPKTKIRVTQDHINKGKPVEAGACPIALALRERFPDKDIRVFPKIMTLGRYQNKVMFSKKNSSSVRKFVEEFDKYWRHPNQPGPFNFMLDYTE